MTFSRIALIGFGEVGQTLAEDLTGRAVLSVWDIAFVDGDSAPSRALARHRIRAGRNAPDAVRDAELVISAVTADQDLAAAASVGAGLSKGAWETLKPTSE